jgi:hypothetical protein
MNPRFRRLLIPGLLVALLAVVLVVAIAREASGAEPTAPVPSTVVSRITDPRIAESSGLAISRTHDDLAYTINDSGNAAIVFAVRISTGQVVGTTRIAGATWLDTEAMALRGSTLWVADTGDNLMRRGDAALYSMPEPGRGNHVVTPARYPVSYDHGPEDVEAVLVHPRTGRILLLAKGVPGGTVYRLPKTLRRNAPNVATDTGRPTPVLTTDATYTNDGREVLVRNYIVTQVRAADSWKLIRTDTLPDQPQGETIAMEPSGRSYLIGSEGRSSALIRVPFDGRGSTASATPTPAEPTPTPTPAASDSDGDGTRVPIALVALASALVAVGAVVLVARRRTSRS